MSSNWWVKKSHRMTPVVVKMENPNNWSMVELHVPSKEHFLNDSVSSNNQRSHNKNAKQLTWVLLLKAHRAAGCITSIASTTFSLSYALRRRVTSGLTDTESDAGKPVTTPRRFYTCIKACLWLSVVLLGFEIAAYCKGWQLGAPDLHLQYLYTLMNPIAFKGFFDWIYSKWVLIRVEYLAPPLQFLANSCVILFLLQSLDRFVQCLGCFWIRFMKIKPVANETLSDLESGDGDGFFPMVLVQIPMCNEKEVYQQSIEAVCNLNWPKSKILIQVLDDSDDPTAQLLIKEEVLKWKHDGANIVYRHRVIRDGYKAGTVGDAIR